jgi:APA family basic amino acid/polyamine antiporter
MGIFAKLFRIKSVESILSDSAKAGVKLKRSLTGIDLIFLGIGGIIGAGIFATIGTAAAGDAHRLGAGPALMLSFVLTAIACGFSALCYAEFAAMVPISGSAYTYAYTTLGELVAWIIGWDLIIEYAIGNVAVAISWSGYFSELLLGFGLKLPDWMTIDYRTALAKGGIIADAPHFLGLPIVFNLPAVAIVTILTILIVVGIKESAYFNKIMVVTKLLVLAFFCTVGFFYVKPEHFIPFAPNGFSGILTGASIVFFAYIGFDAVSTLAEETKNPARDLPIGIIGSLIICTIVYILVTVVFTGLVPYATLKNMLASVKAEPLTMALRYVGETAKDGFFSARFLNLSAGIVAFGSVVAHTAVLLVFQIGQPRILFSMSRDGLLPPKLMAVHPKYKTPHVATILTGIFVATFAAFMNIDEMVDLCNIGTLFAFILVCIGIIILRVREPNRPRPFKAWGGYLVPVLGIFTSMSLVYGLPLTTWVRFFIWLLVGGAIYLSYGIRHSRLATNAAGDKPPTLENMDAF